MISNIIHIVNQQAGDVHYDNFIVRVMAADMLDMDNAGDMRVFLLTLVKGGVKKIVIDMTGLDFIDSSGIGVLIDAAKHLRQRGGDIVILSMPERVHIIVQPVRLNRFIKFFEREDEVIYFFRHV
ncbi:MAG: STAS domain-containing protein [Spirochaetes bacterium]|nr:STAS domain-containing protein [Spirochaetota bacterium]